MKKSTHRSKREMKAAIKRRHNNQLRFLRMEYKKVPAAANLEHHHRNDDINDKLLVDRISKLPDEILISILSRLTLPQAMATSILSTRWRYLHTYIDHLKFPPCRMNMFCGFWKLLVSEFQVEFSNYISSINRTLDSYRGNGSVLKEFSVDMDCLEGTNIERWLEFALSRQVEIIDLRLRFWGAGRISSYTLHLSKLIGQSLPGLKCLKQMYLRQVHVDDLDVQLLVSTNNFPLLESLAIESSARLINVSIVGHGPLLPNKLKHLDISYAENLKSIEIRDMINLVSFKCYGYQFEYTLRLNNLPKLTELDFRELYHHTLAWMLLTIPSCLLDQLRLLKVSTSLDFSLFNMPALCELINVKHLVLKVDMKQKISTTTRLFRIIEACTSLEKLEIEFLWPNTKNENLNDSTVVLFSPENLLSPNLKFVTISGYLGSSEELGFALVIMKHAAASLEEVIIEPCDLTRKIRKMATARALKQFKPPIIPNSMSFNQFSLLLGFIIVCGLFMYYVFMLSLG